MPAIAVALLVVTIVALAASRASADLLLSGKVVTRSRAITIPSSFLGFSIEWSTVSRHLGAPVLGPNKVYDGLLANLAAYGGGIPTLRVGGSSQDEAMWQPSGRLTAQDYSRGFTTAITPAKLESLA